MTISWAVNHNTEYRLGGTLWVLSPELSGARGSEADSFLQGLESKVPRRHVEVAESDTELGVPERDDVVVVLIPATPEQLWRLSVRTFLTDAIDKGGDVIPVALRRDQRPPAPLEHLAPFSVQEIIESYHLGPSQYREAGSVFARVAVSRLWPTYSRERLRLFLSHRREDGEALVRKLDFAIADLNHHPARDLADIRPGTQIAASIVQELNESDVFVLCDTPQASGDHPWLKDELCVALGLGLPIVWARFGQVGNRSELPIIPADTPDLDLPWPGESTDYHATAASIVDIGYTAGRNQVRRMESCIAQARRVMEVEVLDARRRILLLQRPRRLGPFELKDRIVVQAYARRPTSEDREHFREWLRSEEWMSDNGRLQAFDIAATMAPSPVWNREVSGESRRVTELEGVRSSHGSSLVTALTRPAGEKDRHDDQRELLLFAGIGPGQGARQEFRDAVQDVAIRWLGRGGRIRFGGHPTVTPTVNWAARSEVPGREREQVTIYQSRFFVTPQLLSEISEIAEVVPTEVRGTGADARQESLTHMRERMIEESNAVAAVVIGGLTREESNRQPGVEEEMLLARRRGIPVFILGATGGQAAVLVNQESDQDSRFAVLGNVLSEEENDFLATTDDYMRATDIIWTATDRPT